MARQWDLLEMSPHAFKNIFKFDISVKQKIFEKLDKTVMQEAKKKTPVAFGNFWKVVLFLSPQNFYMISKLAKCFKMEIPVCSLLQVAPQILNKIHINSDIVELYI